MKPGMNDMRARDYRVTERILNICINYANYFNGAHKTQQSYLNLVTLCYYRQVVCLSQSGWNCTIQHSLVWSFSCYRVDLCKLRFLACFDQSVIDNFLSRYHYQLQIASSLGTTTWQF